MLIIGHRGASSVVEENTVAAFRLADEMGADGVELDVRRGPDGRLFVKHDPLASNMSALDQLPTFREILGACGDMLVNVEIKNAPDEPGYDPSGAVVESTIAEMRLHGVTDRWILSSFDWNTIEQCRLFAPDILTAYLVTTATVEAIQATAAAGHCAIHPYVRTVTAELVEQCHDAGLAVNTWTCNDPDRVHELDALGVDGVCTDVPDVALTAIGRDERSVNPQWGRRA